jgi:hypothetical protein
VASSDLNPAQNSGATYFAEGQYLTPHEYVWCQSHPGQCNMYNNASYRRFNVSGSGDNYTFSTSGSTVRMQGAIKAWQTLGGATVNQPFTFTATGTCGGTVSATLQLQDGALNLGTATFVLPLGQITTFLRRDSIPSAHRPCLLVGPPQRVARNRLG